MTESVSYQGTGPAGRGLRGRRTECEALDRLMASGRAGPGAGLAR